jgi:hypothetical protein
MATEALKVIAAATAAQLRTDFVFIIYRVSID